MIIGELRQFGRSNQSSTGGAGGRFSRIGLRDRSLTRLTMCKQLHYRYEIS